MDSFMALFIVIGRNFNYGITPVSPAPAWIASSSLYVDVHVCRYMFRYDSLVI